MSDATDLLEKHFEYALRNQMYGTNVQQLFNAYQKQRKVLERARVLLGLLTVRQVIEAGDNYIEAAGLNPYCMNEGLATGSEPISTWWLEP